MKHLLQTAGEHPFVFSGGVGTLEAIANVPESWNRDYIALLGHPHSLQGGTMNNKVITTLARALKELGILSIRFNFRGVGNSEGHYSAGVGESQDMLILAKQCHEVFPDTKLMFAGFSFGSYVAYRSAGQYPHALLITIAPPVHHYHYAEFTLDSSSWIVVQGGEDEVVPSHLVTEFVSEVIPQANLLMFKNTGHFFHGKLVELKTRLKEAIKDVL